MVLFNQGMSQMHDLLQIYAHVLRTLAATIQTVIEILVTGTTHYSWAHIELDR